MSGNMVVTYTEGVKDNLYFSSLIIYFYKEILD